MALELKKSQVSRAAVDKTIQRGIGLWQMANENKPCPPHIVEQIRATVIRQANIMNIERGYRGQ